MRLALRSRRASRTYPCDHLGRSDAVDEADLLETLLARGEADLPAVVDDLVDHGEGGAELVHPVLHVHVHVATETCELEGRSQGVKRDPWTIFRVTALLFSQDMLELSHP